MKRLTYWNQEYDCWSYSGPSGEAAKRLAAYEDTGVSPEGVKGLIARALLGALESPEMEEYHGSALERADNLIEQYESLGPLEHIKELIQAEKEGRLVVLPCKPNGGVYQWKKGDDIPSLFRFDGVNINEDGEIAYQTHWGETFTLDDFGKTVFLTREEAEAAPKKREEADNETD